MQYRSYASPITDSGSMLPRRRKIEIEVVENVYQMGPAWMYPAGGSSQHVQPPPHELEAIQDKLSDPKPMLSEWPATSISGNDILASVLYAGSSVVAKSGKLMPIPLLFVAVVLYFFRFIYEEVVTAIPLNGGSYNALLNTTSKKTAALAATLSVLSYIATGVVSSTSGVKYLATQVDIPIVGCTIALLFVFAVLALLGITDNSRVALAIFMHHTVVLTVLLVACIIYAVQHPSDFKDNMKVPYPAVDVAGTMYDGTVFSALFFGFGAAMLGITGFESSSNYVEEQAPGVFRKTLRNMWGMVSFFNVLLGTAILGVVPLNNGENGMYSHLDALFAQAAFVAAGKWLQFWVSVDAFVVLAGSVLTSYVGICGLLRRLANDRVVPSFFATANKWRGTNHYIIFFYFLLATSLVVVLDADSTILNGVYTYAFLGLMALFACGCMMLKAKRSDIPRDVHAPWSSVIFGFVMVVIALLANLLGDPQVLFYFSMYFLVVIFAMYATLERVQLLRILLVIMKSIAPSKSQKFFDVMSDTMQHKHTGARGGRTITKAIIGINQAPIIFFCKTPNLTLLNKAVVYVRRNEQTHNLRFVHIYGDDEEAANEMILKEFEAKVALLDHMYPKIRVDFVSVRGAFTPAVIDWLSRSMNIPKNMMFIRTPSKYSAHLIVSTSGVRVITA